MRIDPTDTSSVQSPDAHKFDDIAMRHDRRLMHLLVVGQQLLAPPGLVPDEELSVHEVMPTYVALRTSMNIEPSVRPPTRSRSYREVSNWRPTIGFGCRDRISESPELSDAREG